MKLSETKIKLAKSQDKKYRLTDGQGLSLMIHPNNTKIWHFRYQYRQVSRDISIGEYPIIGLSQAREKRDEYRKILFNDIDPKINTNEIKHHLFKDIALEWINTQKRWSFHHRVRVIKSIENNINTIIGDIPINNLTTKLLIEPIKIIENSNKLELASRLQQRTNSIMRYAVQQGYISYNPAQDLVGIVAKQKTTHRPALNFVDLPDFIYKVKEYKGRKLTQLALQLLLLTFVRSSELRLARWNEIDFVRNLWTIPGEREPIEGVRFSYRGAKMKETHLVPLSKQSINILKELKLLTGENTFIFVSDHNENKPMSENTLNKALRFMGYDTKTELCSHGFRTMACSALVESNLWSTDAIEHQMSHRERNKVRAAYIHKAEHINVREKLMQWWADYLDTISIEFIPPYAFSQNITAN